MAITNIAAISRNQSNIPLFSDLFILFSPFRDDKSITVIARNMERFV